MFGGTVDPDARQTTGVGLGLGANVPPSASDPAVKDSASASNSASAMELEGVLPYIYPQGWRSGKEVVRLLRNQGANMTLLRKGSEVDADEWALVSSDGEVEMEPEMEMDTPPEKDEAGQ